MNREKIGIPAVDEMIEGGLPFGSICGVSGPPGVGKSIFSLHFLLEGARKGQKSLYINLEEPKINLDNLINQFSFADEFKKFLKSGKIVIKCFTYSEYEKIYKDLLKKIKEDNEIKRLVVDSFNCFFMSSVDFNGFTNNPILNSRIAINHAFQEIRRKNLTVLLILEKNIHSGSEFYQNIPYLLDGIIDLDFLELGVIERRIFIPKMRWTNQYKESKSFEISEQGIFVIDEN